MIYLSGVIGPGTAKLAEQGLIGMLAQPMSNYAPENIRQYPWYACDNACFSKGKDFNLGAFLEWLERMPKENCLFAAAPDVLGDAEATLKRSAPVLTLIRDAGFKAALVTQNGLDKLEVPWDSFDCLFIGGDDAWKLGTATVSLVQQARERGKWVHMGRVNSEKRLQYAALIGCDSADGTFLKYAPDHNIGRMLRWFQNMENKPTLPLFAAERQE